jgi:TolB protein
VRGRTRTSAADVAWLILAFLVGCTQNPESATRSSLPPSSSRILDDAMVFDSNRGGNFEVYSMRDDGSDVVQLTFDAHFDSWWPRISPDRRHVLFYRTPAGTHEDYSQTSLWVMAADGTDPVELRPTGTDGWQVQGHAEWSPTGDELVMFGGSKINPQIQVTTPEGGDPRPVTDRGGQNVDPSWAPDGRSILFAGCPTAICFPGSLEIYEVAVSGGEPRRLTYDSMRDDDPYVSPDGATVAWLTQVTNTPPVGTWGTRSASRDGTGVRWIINDGNVNSHPTWSPHGNWIYFHRFESGAAPRFSIYRIRPDGSDLELISADTSVVDEYPSL